MNENRDELQAKHPPEYIQNCRVEAVVECEDGVLEARTSTGEIFAVIPTASEHLKLPEAGDEVRLYLEEGPGGAGLVVGVDINDEPVYYEPPAPGETSSPSEADVSSFNDLWASWGSLTSQEPQVAQFTQSSGSLHLPAEHLADLRERARERDRMGLNRMGLALGMSHLSTFPTLQSPVSGNDPGAEDNSVSWEEKLSYLDAIAPGWRETYRSEFGREPGPEDLADLISRETGGRRFQDR